MWWYRRNRMIGIIIVICLFAWMFTDYDNGDSDHFDDDDEDGGETF
jgi:hypothetical protein